MTDQKQKFKIHCIYKKYHRDSERYNRNDIRVSCIGHTAGITSPHDFELVNISRQGMAIKTNNNFKNTSAFIVFLRFSDGKVFSLKGRKIRNHQELKANSLAGKEIPERKLVHRTKAFLYGVSFEQTDGNLEDYLKKTNVQKNVIRKKILPRLIIDNDNF